MALESQWARLEQREQLVAILIHPSLNIIGLVALIDQ